MSVTVRNNHPTEWLDAVGLSAHSIDGCLRGAGPETGALGNAPRVPPGGYLPLTVRLWQEAACPVCGCDGGAAPCLTNVTVTLSVAGRAVAEEVLTARQLHFRTDDTAGARGYRFTFADVDGSVQVT